MQGHGTFGAHEPESATRFRFGEWSADEFFVSEGAAKGGIVVCHRGRMRGNEG